MPAKKKRRTAPKFTEPTDPLVALVNAFFGTVTERDPSEGIRRPKHAHDGWRDGKSHQFKYEGKTYDALKTPQESFKQYQALRAQIERGR